MAAIGRRTFLWIALAGCARCDDAGDVHRVIGDLAEALSSGEVEQAMSGFSKKCPDYRKLNEYFDALTSAYFVENRIEFLDQEISSTSAEIAIRWALALTTRQSGFTTNRNAELTAKLILDGKHWRITNLSPIDIFDPQAG